MSNKQKALETIQRLPETATLEDIMAELYFLQKVEEGLDDMRQGRVVDDSEVQRRIEQWLRR